MGLNKSGCLDSPVNPLIRDPTLPTELTPNLCSLYMYRRVLYVTSHIVFIDYIKNVYKQIKDISNVYIMDGFQNYTFLRFCNGDNYNHF